MSKEYLTVADLIRHLQCCDKEARILIKDKNENLRYLRKVDEDQSIQLSADEFDVLSNYFDVQKMEADYLDGSGDTLDFFSVVTLSEN